MEPVVCPVASAIWGTLLPSASQAAALKMFPCAGDNELDDRSTWETY